MPLSEFSCSPWIIGVLVAGAFFGILWHNHRTRISRITLSDDWHPKETEETRARKGGP
jgi:predicted outer membrane lipoprotein